MKTLDRLKELQKKRILYLKFITMQTQIFEYENKIESLEWDENDDDDERQKVYNYIKEIFGRRLEHLQQQYNRLKSQYERPLADDNSIKDTYHRYVITGAGNTEESCKFLRLVLDLHLAIYMEIYRLDHYKETHLSYCNNT